MKKTIQYYWGEDSLKVDLGNRVESRIKLILCVEFMVTVAMATVFLFRSLQMQQSIVAVILCLGACILYGMASYRLISRFYYKEQLVITRDHFTIITKTLLYKKILAYDWRYVGTLHYVGKDFRNSFHNYNEGYDYLDFSKQQFLLQDLHQSGNLFFNYKNTGVRFARGIYSWHAEEIVRMIQLFTGSSLKLGAEWQHLIETSEWEE